MKRPALTLPASLRALQPPEVLRALDAARAPARPRRVAATPVVTSARVEASGAVVARVDGLRVILVERDARWCDVARARCAAAVEGREWRRPEQPSLFGDGAR